MKNIKKIAKKLKINAKNLIFYGNYKAKIEKIEDKNINGNLILVTSITPTKSGNGKTTVSIGLADALKTLKKNVCVVLREPSMGPVFGVKGGAVGGGKSLIIPEDDINLHFTGDMHAITSANNLIVACVENHIFQGNELDFSEVLIKRCLDVNDRSLRGGFVITPASEIMAIVCLCKDLEDLENRIANILVGITSQGKPIFCGDLNIQHAVAIILKDAIKPNIVQTLNETPAIVHGGPFANIAHGCNSLMATKMALSLADYVITEAGFGADLGAEKFFDIKCRLGNLNPKCVVLVVTVRALKQLGNVLEENLNTESIDAVKCGLWNLDKHINNLKNLFGMNVVVAINRFETDSNSEINCIKEYLNGICEVEECSPFTLGAFGCLNLANKVIQETTKDCNLKYVYNLEESIEAKIEKIVKNVYGLAGVNYSQKALKKIQFIKKNGFEKFFVVIAKTPYSFTDDELTKEDYTSKSLNIEDIDINSGAEFIVVKCKKIMLMPGLPKIPRAVDFKI